MQKGIRQFINGIFSFEVSSNKKHYILKILWIKFKLKRTINYKKRYKNIIKKLKSELAHRKLRVCFLVSETSKWNAQSLYKQMKESDIFEPFVVVTNLTCNIGRHSYSHLLEFYKSCVDNVEIGWDENTKQGIDLRTFNPDIVFYQQPWDLYENQNVEYVSQFALTYHFSYAIGDPSHCIKDLYINFYNILFKYFVFSINEANEYKKIVNKCHNLSVVGHPKLDIYNDYNENNYSHKYVIYAPHHSFEENSLNYATFNWNGEYILNWAKQHPEYDWVFKPHPRFKQALILNNIMSETEVEEYFKSWQNIGICYEDGAYFDLFKNSKCLITDCGSFLVEYLPTLQPIIHLRNPKATDYVPACKIAMKSFYKAWNVEELEQLLNKVLVNNTDSEKCNRIDALDKLQINQFNSTKKIIDCIKTDIGITK